MKKVSILLLMLIFLLAVGCQNNEPEATTIPDPTATSETAVATAETRVDPVEEPTDSPVEEPEAEAVMNEDMEPLPADLVAQLDDLLQTLVYTEGTDPSTTAPGVILLVDTPEGRYLQAAGVASLENATPVQVDDRFEIGSNSKSFTVALLMQLQEQGVLSLDDSLSTWLPDWAAKIPNGDEMTLRQLAQHTSGIWDYGDAIIGRAAANPVHLEDCESPEQLVQYAIDNGTPDFAPGEEGQWSYSNTGYILLGMVIEAATGEKLGDLYQSHIFAPLGLESAVLIEDVPEPHEIVNGYYWTDDGHELNTTKWNVSQGWAAGGLAMTAEDLLTYAKALSAGELFQDPDTLAQMLTFDPNGMDGSMPYGLGLMDFSLFGAPDYWGHEGQTAGFQTLWYTDPENDTTVVGLSNSATYQAFIFLKVASMLAPESSDEAGEETSVTENSEPCPLHDLPYPRPEPAYNGKLERDFSPFTAALEAYTAERAVAREALVKGKTIPELQALMDSRELTSVELVIYYLERIQRYDVDKLNSVLELNPELLEIAQALDDERAAGSLRGAMHGIPVLLKDNIATGDQLHTAAGATAMLNWDPDRDAFLVNQLRDAGAIIMGKANLSEWANYMDSCSPNGFSTNGGQTQNPYGPFETYGSSSGSAVSVAADLTTVSVGSETQGSLIMPSGINSVVGLKTSRGMISGDYIIPLLSWQDVAGPIGRSVTDVAVLLSAMTGVDANDPNTQKATALAGTDFTQFLLPEAVNDVSVGIPIFTDEWIEQQIINANVSEEQSDPLRQYYQSQNSAFRNLGEQFVPLGIEVVEVDNVDLPDLIDVGSALEYGYKEDINQFLSALGDRAPVASLEAIVAFNNEDLSNRAPYGQDSLEASQNTTVTADQYELMKTGNQETAVTALTNMFDKYNIDVIVSDVNQTYAPAGFPALTVPVGYGGDGTPQGIVFVGNFLGEPQLITVGYAFEQVTQARVAPNLEATMQLIETMEQSSP